MHLFKIEQRFSENSITVLKKMIGATLLRFGMENAQIKITKKINSFSSIDCYDSINWICKTKEGEQKIITLNLENIFPFSATGKTINLDDSITDRKAIEQLGSVSVFSFISNLDDSTIIKIEIYHHVAEYEDSSIKNKSDHYFLKDNASVPEQLNGVLDVFNFWTHLVFYLKDDQFIILERDDFDNPSNLSLYFSDKKKLKYIKTYINDDINKPMFTLIKVLD